MSGPRSVQILDRTHPWDRLNSEGAIAHHAFLHYRDMPASHRSVMPALRIHNRECRGMTPAPGEDYGRKKRPRNYASWWRWSRDYEWDSRAAAWDKSLDLSQRAAIEAAQRDYAAEWVRRRAEFREDAYQDSRAIVAVMRKMLAHPLTEEVTTTHEEATDDGKVLIVRQHITRPSKWTMADVGKLALAAHRMAAMATELSDDEQPVTIQSLHKMLEDVGRGDGIDPSEILREIETMQREEAEAE